MHPSTTATFAALLALTLLLAGCAQTLFTPAQEPQAPPGEQAPPEAAPEALPAPTPASEPQSAPPVSTSPPTVVTFTLSSAARGAFATYAEGGVEFEFIVAMPPERQTAADVSEVCEEYRTLFDAEALETEQGELTWEHDALTIITTHFEDDRGTRLATCVAMRGEQELNITIRVPLPGTDTANG